METILAKLIDQAPLAVLVAVVAITLIRLFHKREEARDRLFLQQLEERDKQNQTANTERDKAFQSALGVQLDLMRKFWDSQQVSNRDVLERLVHSVEAVMAVVQRHDEKFDLAVGKMFERTQDEPPEGLNLPAQPRRRPPQKT
jgi:hypothetical protein